jgi:lipoyl(octanoyl) transferase
MQTLVSKFLDATSLETFGLSLEHIRVHSERVLIVRKWNWDYSQAHNFQKHCVSLLQEIPQVRVLIMTSHPRLFTNGRGLQKPKKGESFELVDFDPSLKDRLPFPLFQIERGGGLTFHHPGQFVFYPIVKLHPQKLSLSKMIDDIFETAKLTLEAWGVTGLSTENKLLGLWHGQHKLASMGIAIERMTTFHGMALNLSVDQEMNEALNSLNPCGLSAKTYQAVEELISLPSHPHEAFSEAFIQRLTHGWQ